MIPVRLRKKRSAMPSDKNVPEIKTTKITPNAPFWLAGITLPLTAGLILYAAFRPDSIVCHIISPIIPSFLTSHTSAGAALSFVRYYAGDVLWAYSLTFTVSLIVGQSCCELWLSAGLSILLETAFEFLQKQRVVAGTFDPRDICWEAAATVAAIIIIFIHHRRKSH